MNHFTDSIAVVTGGASGIGRGLCEELGRRGATVVVADVNAEGAERVASGITAAGGRAQAKTVDTAQAEAVQQLVDGAVSEHGRLDYLFNNAGIALGGDCRDVTLEHWRRIVDINLLGVIYGTIAAYSVMAHQGSGHIVNTASMAGLMPVPIETAYATTKFAVVGLSQSLRAEGADLGVKVSVVCPGFVRTGIFDASVMPNIDKAKLFAQLPSRMVDPADAARIILDGVVRNRAVIAFPFAFRVLWWLYRLCPALFNPLQRKLVADSRAARKTT